MRSRLSFVICRSRSFRGLCLTFHFLLFFLIASCVPAGVADLTASGEHMAIVSDGDLYVVPGTSPEITFYARRPDTRFAPILTPDGEAVIYVDQLRNLVRQPLDGSEPATLFKQVGLPGPGAIVYLPGDELLLLDSSFQTTGERFVKILDAETGIESQPAITGIEQIFVTANALDVKAGGSLTNPFNAARIEADEPGQLKVVFRAKTCLIADQTCLYLYSADAEGFVFKEQLPRSLKTDMILLLARRPQDDVTGGLLTADGKHLILRVRDGVPIGSAYSLYAIDLTNNNPPVPLVKDALRRPDYAIAPDGNWVAYELVTNNISQVMLYNFDTGAITSVGTGAFDPQWWK
jgi:hypothetical protein